MVNYFFTSDWHLGHNKILKLKNRPYKSIEEMDQSIIEKHNKLVEPQDIVYFLGDFAMKKTIFLKYIDQINGKIVFILGNHDYKYVSAVREKLEEVYRMKAIRIEGQTIVLSHYPMYFHYRSHHNAWQLYGHLHHDVSDIVQGKKMNVNFDVCGFKTLSLEDVKQYMRKRSDNIDFKKHNGDDLE